MLTVIVTYWALLTPVSGTISSLPLKTGTPAVAVPSVTVTVPPVTGLSKVKTIVCTGPRRGSVVGFDARLPSAKSNVPAMPCTSRDAAPSRVGAACAPAGNASVRAKATASPARTPPFRCFTGDRQRFESFRMHAGTMGIMS